LRVARELDERNYRDADRKSAEDQRSDCDPEEAPLACLSQLLACLRVEFALRRRRLVSDLAQASDPIDNRLLALDSRAFLGWLRPRRFPASSD
jgi:hypothetical protein